MTIGFQWIDKHFQKPMEDRIHNRALIDTMRIFTNPPQSMANFFRFRTPWYRDNRPSVRLLHKRLSLFQAFQVGI